MTEKKELLVEPVLFDIGDVIPTVAPVLPPEPKIVQIDLTEPFPFKPLTGARFSEDRKCRYNLWRRFKETGRTLLCLGVNPSTAGEVDNDPTVSRMESFAKRDDFALLLMGNIFAHVSTDPKELRKQADPVGPDNNAWLIKMRKMADVCICAWGNNGKLKKRDKAVIDLLLPYGPLHCFGINKNGSPKHPLYLSGKTKIVKFATVLEEEF